MAWMASGRMGGRWPGDGDNVDTDVERVGQGGAGVVDAQALGPAGGARRILADQGHYLEAGRAKGRHMDSGPERGPDDGGAQAHARSGARRGSPAARSAGGQPSTRPCSAQNGWLSIRDPFLGGSFGSSASQAITSPQTSGGAA